MSRKPHRTEAQPDMHMILSGFSQDGFIIDQSRFSSLRYRETGSHINGCGWIAAYNLLRSLGADVDYDIVRRGMDAMIRLRIPGPTPTRVLLRYLAPYTGTAVLSGRRAARQASGRAGNGILRYWEGREPHFVTFIRQPDGRFRFLNVTPALRDITMPMERFLEERCRFGSVRMILASAKNQQSSAAGL